MADKEAKRQAEMLLTGQDSDDARAAVKRQRELKKKKDAHRKAEKKLKAAAPGSEEHRAIQDELREIEAAITQLEGPTPGASAVEPAASPPSQNSPPASSPSPAQTAAEETEADRKRREEKELKKQSELSFMGQDTDEAKAAVKRQRELKKKKDALRKVQKKLGALPPDGDAYKAAKEEEAALSAEVRALDGGGAATSGDAKAAGGADKPKIAAVADEGTAGGVAGPPTKVAAAPVREEENVEANAAKLRQMVERAMRESRGTLPIRHRDSIVHPRVAEVTIMMEEMLLVGGNARALAMIAAFREMFHTTTILAGSSLQDIDTQAFTELVERNFAFMRRKREANTGMRYVKEAVVRRLIAVRDEIVQHRHRGSGSGEHAGNGRCHSSSARDSGASHHQHSSILESFPGDAREVALQILDMIDSEIRMSVKSIVEERSLPYVSSSDTILVFGRSSVVEFLLLSRIRNAQRRPKKVIVVDSAPLYEGRELAQKLSEVGIPVTYGLITAACTLMPKCTRVFIGASSVLQNGDVFGRCGTALVAACAKIFRKPVLCFAESYKFVSEVWVGNLAQNTKLMDIKDASPMHDGGASRSPLAYSTPPSFSLPQLQSTQGFGGFGVGGPHGAWGRGADDFTPPLLSSTGATATSTPVPTSGGGGAFPALVAISSSSSAASGYLYDVTPAAYVDMIICEMGCLHTSAIIAAIKDREGRDASPAMVLTMKNAL